MTKQLTPALALVLSLALGGEASAQIAYGVNAAGSLFRFDVDDPTTVWTIGPVGFVPEGIDFRPSSGLLYAIEVGPNTSQLYTIDTSTAAATPVGPGFTSTGAAPDYNLLGNQTFGFDFNPTTLQGDGSMRIRLVSTNGENLRLNSSTGLIAGVDTDLLIQPGSASPFVDGAAYSNNVAQNGGTTVLYDMDSRNNRLYTQIPPGAGQLNEVGPFGVTIDAERNIGFDIYTSGGVDEAFAVFTRPDAPLASPGSYVLYNVNLATGATTGGALVGPVATPFDFVGGFAVSPVEVPEPAALLLGAFALGLARRLR
ncbi:MAG: DUF4394 domain-containing protein [Lacipirellulaceae bacterium]